MRYTKDNEMIHDEANNRFVPCNETCEAYVDIMASGVDIEPYIVPDPQTQINTDNRAYLTSTDWYVVRYAEKNIAIPDEITTARDAARSAII